MGSVENAWRVLDVAIIGGGIGRLHFIHISKVNKLITFCETGGLAAAISLRRAGHKLTIYERADFAGEVGASISCAANGTRWLETWGVDIAMGKPVILKKLISHDWATGEDVNIYDLADYKERWGYVCSVAQIGWKIADSWHRCTTCSTGLTCMRC
jgi:salicylate hydroxylase